ncbi:MAG: hydrogenase, partial [bacterium]
MIWLLILIPLLLAVAAAVTPSNRWRPFWVPVGGLAHLVVMGVAVGAGPASVLRGWLALDALGMLVLGFISLLFFLCALYAPAYLALRPDRPNRVFCACLLTMLSMMSLVALSHHLGLMWVGMEATTLATAPLLFFNHNARSLEATW